MRHSGQRKILSKLAKPNFHNVLMKNYNLACTMEGMAQLKQKFSHRAGKPQGGRGLEACLLAAVEQAAAEFQESIPPSVRLHYFALSDEEQVELRQAYGKLLQKHVHDCLEIHFQERGHKNALLISPALLYYHPALPIGGEAFIISYDLPFHNRHLPESPLLNLLLTYLQRNCTTHELYTDYVATYSLSRGHIKVPRRHRQGERYHWGLKLLAVALAERLDFKTNMPMFSKPYYRHMLQQAQASLRQPEVHFLVEEQARKKVSLPNFGARLDKWRQQKKAAQKNR